MEIVKCNGCGKEEPYREDTIQICWDCNQHMTLKGLPETVVKCIKAPIGDYGCFVAVDFSEVSHGK